MDKALAIRDEMPLLDLGTVLAKSGFFQDATDPGKAIVKILAGRELGIPAIASMTGINIIKGRVAISANLMAAVVKRTGKYNYRVIEHTATVCEIAFLENGEKVGTSRFTADDAKRAGTQNMERFPKNMLFARAMSNGAKWFCADVFGGPVYTPEEMGAKVDEEGDVIDMPVQASKPANGNGHAAPAPVVDDEQDTPAAALLETKTPTINAPAPEKEFGRATVKIHKESAAFAAALKQFIVAYPKYQGQTRGKANGEPNMFHILSAAGKCGFAEINDDNWPVVIEQIAERAAKSEPVAA